MKTFVAILLLSATRVLADPTTNAPSVTLAWDRVMDPIVNGYAVYWGAAPRAYTNSIIVSGATNTTATVANLARGTTYYFAATSKATNGLESAYSSEVTYSTSPLPTAVMNLSVSTKSP